MSNRFIGEWSDLIQVDAFRQQLLVDLIKASFGGDRSAAGRYAANMRWRGQGQRKVAGFVGKGVYKLGADGSIHPKALVEEMLAEHPDGGPPNVGQEDKKWKSLVGKNIATNMTDVSVKEIIDVIDNTKKVFGDTLDIQKSFTAQDIREVLDGKVKRFILTKNGTIIDASKDDFVANQISKLKMEHDPRIYAQQAKHWDQMAEDGQVFDANTPEGQIALKQAAVKPLVDAWAFTSNDANELSLAIQDVAQKVFAVDALSWEVNTEPNSGEEGGQATYSDKITYRPATKITDERTKVLSSFLNAQYAATQQYFEAKGIKEVTLFRGMKEKPFDPDEESGDIVRTFNPKKTEILMRPLSSWATRIDIARDFTNDKKNGVIVKARIKTKDILSIPYTGVGCWMEFEAVVIGRPVQGSYVGGYEANTSSSVPGAYRERVKDWAYEDETGEAP